MRIYFAGGESWADLLLDMGVKYQLFSYFYFRSMLHGRSAAKAYTLLARMRMAQKKGYSFMLDSGAFTYLNTKKVMPPPREYFEEYRQFLKMYGDLFDIIVELDVEGVPDGKGGVISIQQVNEWTNSLLDDPALGSRIMPVYHLRRGRLWLQDWLTDTRSPYIALASSASAQVSVGTVISMAHRFGKFIHGLAQTRLRTDAKYHAYDSVDSTTWLRADKYGGTFIYRNGRLVILDYKHKKDRALYRDYFESWGLDWKKIAKDDLHEMRMATIIAWREMANDFERKWAIRTNGKHPYLWEAHARGEVPQIHPIVSATRKLVEARQRGE